MKKVELIIGVLLAALLGVFGLTASAGASSGVSAQGVEPVQRSGNFVSSGDDQQVCFDLSALGYIGEVTEDMTGVKVDPPVNFSDGNVTVTLSADGRYLDWETEPGITMLAVVVKGGPNFHVYDYVGTGLTADQGLHSPVHKKNTPQISHYNFCYSVDDVPPINGCTPGYWRNHADRWFGANPSDDFDATFGVDVFDPDIPLGQAVQVGGGGVNALARHATAGLLNAYGGVPNSDGTTVAYAYTPGEVVQMVQDAIANGTIEETKDLLAAANEAGCPLSGTSAVPV